MCSVHSDRISQRIRKQKQGKELKFSVDFKNKILVKVFNYEAATCYCDSDLNSTTKEGKTKPVSAGRDCSAPPTAAERQQCRLEQQTFLGARLESLVYGARCRRDTTPSPHVTAEERTDLCGGGETESG